METEAPVVPNPVKALRLWPGVAAAVVIVVFRVVVPAIIPDAGILGMIAALAGTLAIVIWWLFFSRASWPDRIGAIVIMIAAAFATWPLLHRSITNGMMGMMFPIYAVPVLLGPAFVAAVVLTHRSSTLVRRASTTVAIFLACAAWTLIRTDGLHGSSGAQLAWRWTKTADERLLAQASDDARAAPAPPAASPASPPSPAALEKPAEPPAGKDNDAAKALPASPGMSATKTADTAVLDRTTTVPDPEPSTARPEWPGFRGPN